MTRVKASTLLHWSTEREWFTLFPAVTDLCGTNWQDVISLPQGAQTGFQKCQLSASARATPLLGMKP